MALAMDVVHAVFASPLLFPKKHGAALEKALPFVEEVYGPSLGRTPCTEALPSGPRAAFQGKLLHVSYHSLPDDGRKFLKLAVVFVLTLAWVALYPTGLKLRCALCAVIYSFTESSFTYFERGACYTSVAQFFGNLLYIPVLLDVYGIYLENRPLLYVLFFPLNVWLLELVEGALIVWVFGHNVAWCYLDYADEFAWGWLRVGHAVWWWGMGVACLLAYPLLQALTG